MTKTAWRIRISKADWAALGGLRNSDLFRTVGANGCWQYYRVADNAD